MRLYDGVSFGIEGDSTDRRPVSSIARPARRVAFASLQIQDMSRSENRVIVACVALSRADVPNTAVTMIEVVPVGEASHPNTRFVEIGEPLGGELGPVLGGTKQRLGIGIVVADARPGVRGLDAQPVEHRQDRGGLAGSQDALAKVGR